MKLFMINIFAIIVLLCICFKSFLNTINNDPLAKYTLDLFKNIKQTFLKNIGAFEGKLDQVILQCFMLLSIFIKIIILIKTPNKKLMSG